MRLMKCTAVSGMAQYFILGYLWWISCKMDLVCFLISSLKMQNAKVGTLVDLLQADFPKTYRVRSEGSEKRSKCQSCKEVDLFLLQDFYLFFLPIMRCISDALAKYRYIRTKSSSIILSVFLTLWWLSSLQHAIDMSLHDDHSLLHQFGQFLKTIQQLWYTIPWEDGKTHRVWSNTIC